RTVAEAYWWGANDPQIVMDSRGNGVAIWTQWHGSSWGVWATRYGSVIGWEDPTPIGTSSTQGGDPRIAIDSQGNAIAVWVQGAPPGVTWSIWANRYVFGTGWSVASAIEAGSDAALTPEIAMDSEGNAIAVWIEESATNVSIWTNRYIV